MTSASPIAPTQKPLSVGDAYQLAFALYEKHQFAEAEARLRQVLQVMPKHTHALHLLGVIAQQAGNIALAVQLIQQAIQIEPTEAQFFSNLCEMLRRMGRLDEAVAAGESAVKLAPGQAANHSNLGIAYYDKGEFDQAEECQRRALEIAPALPMALNNLGSIHRERKDYEAAIAYFRKVLEVAPTYHESANNLGSVLTEHDLPEEGLKILLPLIRHLPNYAEAHCNIATAFLALEEFDKAEFGFKRTLELKPEDDKALMGLARVLQEKNHLHDSEIMAERALAAAPKKAEVYSLLGAIHTAAGYPEKAESAFKQALQLDAELISAYLGRGHLRMESGDMDGARSDFNHALSLKENDLGARLAIAQLDKVKAGDENMLALIQTAQKLDTLPEIKSVPLHFALGKCYEDTKQYDLAFQHYQQGCSLKRKRIEYSAENNALATEKIKQFFSKDRLDSLHGAGNESELPIFVLGMPRSGTTLTETIIASHPLVYGAGELNDILEIANQPRGIEGLSVESLGYPDSLQGITQAELNIMGQRYVNGLQTRAPNSPRITDKMPANFNCLGLIHLMLPNAKIVHVKRNPVDTCLSCYTRLFNKSQFQSYDLAEIGLYYRNYAALMDHWRAVLPADSFYEIQYEDIVADQEGEARKLLEFCGLEWDDACLNFHKTERSIRTASVTQVRQPIYKTSIEKWRHYEHHLGPCWKRLVIWFKHSILIVQQFGKRLAAFMLIATLAACASNSVEQRQKQSTQLALDAGWQKLVLATPPFKLAAFVPPNIVKSASLTVYIEGDGMAWVNSTTPSFDPTPRDPLALRLALSDPSGNAVYLARPCQYVMEESPQQCTQKYWTSDRFAPEVIAASNQAINLLKARYSANRIILVGYSGGGAVAALIAAQRTDIQKLVTVVGNLDTTYWTTTRKLSPLSGSLNPADAWRALQDIPQQHLVGGRDKVLGEDVARAYAKHFDKQHEPTISVYPQFDHHCCWESIWPDIVNSGFAPAK